MAGTVRSIAKETGVPCSPVPPMGTTSMALVPSSSGRVSEKFPPASTLAENVRPSWSEVTVTSLMPPPWPCAAPAINSVSETVLAAGVDASSRVGSVEAFAGFDHAPMSSMNTAMVHENASSLWCIRLTIVLSSVRSAPLW